MSEKAIICELDYKGEYSRFALTPEEFKEEFGMDYYEGCERICENTTEFVDTLRPMVHLWTRESEIDGKEWKEFFTDMEWGLPESDIMSGNLATVDLDSCGVLRSRVENTLSQEKSTDKTKPKNIERD